MIKDEHLYYIGGMVRDEFLQIPSLDIDLCYEGNAIEFAKSFNIIKKNARLGTVRVLFDNKKIDIASTRTECYPRSGHLPVVETLGCSLKEDLKRRDFTINAMAKNTLNGELVDYFNGLEDLKNKTLRILHDNSFKDDPTRIIRGLKFAVRFGFKLDSQTQKLQEQYLENINYDISYHRLKKELKETFNLNKQIALDMFINQKMYKLLSKNANLPNISTNIQTLVNKYKPNQIWLVYLGLFDLSNLELSSKEQEILAQYQTIKDLKFNNDIDLYNAFKDLELETLLLYAISIDEACVVNYLENLSKIKIYITGNDLIKLGIKQGKIYKEIFNQITEEKILKNIDTKEDELNYIKTRFAI